MRVQSDNPYASTEVEPGSEGSGCGGMIWRGAWGIAGTFLPVVTSTAAKSLDVGELVDTIDWPWDEPGLVPYNVLVGATFFLGGTLDALCRRRDGVLRNTLHVSGIVVVAVVGTLVCSDALRLWPAARNARDLYRWHRWGILYAFSIVGAPVLIAFKRRRNSADRSVSSSSSARE